MEASFPSPAFLKCKHQGKVFCPVPQLGRVFAEEYLVSRETEFVFTSSFPLKENIPAKVLYSFKHKIKLEEQIPIPFLMARNPRVQQISCYSGNSQR